MELHPKLQVCIDLRIICMYFKEFYNSIFFPNKRRYIIGRLHKNNRMPIQSRPIYIFHNRKLLFIRSQP